MKSRLILSLFLSVLGWFAIVVQFHLMIEARTTEIPETIVRFFSFFTILTNTFVAIYFTMMLFSPHTLFKFTNTDGLLTALSVYIAIVGLVYQVALRHIW